MVNMMLVSIVVTATSVVTSSLDPLYCSSTPVSTATPTIRKAMKLGDEEICWGYITLPRRVPLKHWALVCGGVHDASNHPSHRTTLLEKRAFKAAVEADPTLVDTQSTPFR